MSAADIPGCRNCAREVQDGVQLCTTCTVDLARRLHEVPDLLEQLFVSYAKQDRLGSSNGHRGKLAESPMPVRVDVRRVIDSLGNEVTTWARDLVETHGFEVPTLIRRSAHNGTRGVVFPVSSPTVDAYCYAATWLADHVGQLRKHPAAMEAYNGLTGAIARAELAMDRPEPQLFVGYCGLPIADDSCPAPLYAPRSAHDVRCGRCGGRVIDLPERWDRAKRKLRGYPAVGADIAGWVGEIYEVQVKEGTIRKWHQREEITPVDWVELTEGGQRKVPRFRIGAVLDRAYKAERRKAAMPGLRRPG